MADTAKMTPLEREFHQNCLEGSETLRKECGYNPTYFLRMVHEHGGVEAVRRLLKSENFQAGLTTLWELKRLDDSIEAAVLHKKWAPLFTEAEKKTALKRLEAMDWKKPR